MEKDFQETIEELDERSRRAHRKRKTHSKSDPNGKPKGRSLVSSLSSIGLLPLCYLVYHGGSFFFNWSQDLHLYLEGSIKDSTFIQSLDKRINTLETHTKDVDKTIDTHEQRIQKLEDQ